MDKLIHINSITDYKEVKNFLRQKDIESKEYTGYEVMLINEAEKQVKRIFSSTELDRDSYTEFVEAVSKKYFKTKGILNKKKIRNTAIEVINKIIYKE